jgi:response regulator RpfG family c-di-GMP phosphodiesterase
MKQHARLGYEMLKSSTKKILQDAAIVAYEHHEKWDGTGYPNGLKGEEIHIFGRIIAVADVFDALGKNKPYKEALSDEEIVEFFKNESGKHFEPKIVQILLDNIDELFTIRNNFNDV